MNLNMKNYDKEGIHNTEETLDVAEKRCSELGIKQLVVPTTTGQTALSCAEKFSNLDTIVGVTMHAIDREIKVSRHGNKVSAKDPEIMEKARKAGVKFYTGVHPLRGAVTNALADKFSGFSPQDLISETLKNLFSTGMKVAVESTLMAADGGLIDVSKDAIAIGGYRGGADTAVVLKPAFSYRFFELKIKEIIAFPKSRA